MVGERGWSQKLPRRSAGEILRVSRAELVAVVPLVVELPRVDVPLAAVPIHVDDEDLASRT